MPPEEPEFSKLFLGWLFTIGEVDVRNGRCRWDIFALFWTGIGEGLARVLLTETRLFSSDEVEGKIERPCPGFSESEPESQTSSSAHSDDPVSENWVLALRTWACGRAGGAVIWLYANALRWPKELSGA